MTSRLMNYIEYGASGYLVWGTEQEVHAAPDSPEWFSWLASLSSFHFTGEHGYYTARLEKKARGNQGYWYAYRKVNKHQFRLYLGATDKLSLAHLESIAIKIEEAVLSTPQVKRGKRKPVEVTKESLRDQIKAQEKMIVQKDLEIEKLTMTVEDQGIRLAQLTYQVHQLEGKKRTR